MRWSGATGAIARCKRVSTGCGRKRRSVPAWPWICGVKPTPKAVNKPSPHSIVHGLDKPGGFTTVSREVIESRLFVPLAEVAELFQGPRRSDPRKIERDLVSLCIYHCDLPQFLEPSSRALCPWALAVMGVGSASLGAAHPPSGTIFGCVIPSACSDTKGPPTRSAISCQHRKR